MTIKNKNIIEKKIKEVKKKLGESPVEMGQMFSYWLGYCRALEWLLQKEPNDK